MRVWSGRTPLTNGPPGRLRKKKYKGAIRRRAKAAGEEEKSDFERLRPPQEELRQRGARELSGVSDESHVVAGGNGAGSHQ